MKDTVVLKCAKYGAWTSIAVAIILGSGCVNPISNSAMLSGAPIAVAQSSATSASWPNEKWWEQYDDATLDSLIETALKNAPSLSTAEARFAVARANVQLTDADGLHVDAYGDASRQRLSDNGLFSPKFLGFNWYNQADLGLRGSYAFDWWHKRQHTVSAAVNEALIAKAQHDAVAIGLSASVAQSYFGWQADQAQLALLAEQRKLAEQRREIIQARVDAEVEPIDGVYAADAEIAALREAESVGQYSSRLRRITLAALLGVSIDALPEFTQRALPTPDFTIPENAGIDLLSRRADIHIGQLQIEAAQHRLQSARAEFYPDISINALAGLSSIKFDKLLEAGSAAPSLGAAIHLPLFDSGRLRAQYGVRSAQVEVAIRSYNESIYNAAREVSVYATQIQQLNAQRADRSSQRDAAANLLSVAQARNEQGLTDARARLQASQALQQQMSSLVNLNSAALAAQINLIQALGGGYHFSKSESDKSAAMIAADKRN
jgi:multidrug efflux system outer membrane protein